MKYSTLHTNYKRRHDIFYRLSFRLGKVKDSIVYKWFYLIQKKRISHLIPDFGKKIPVIISNFNRYYTLEQMIAWLESSNSIHLIIVDNGSSNPKTASLYNSLNKEITVLYFKNYKDFRVLNTIADIVKRNSPYYVITDSDLDPNGVDIEKLMKQCIKVLDTYPEMNHVGPSIEINDIIPLTKIDKLIIESEKRYWTNPIESIGYLAPIDTTFAVYRNTSSALKTQPAIRLAKPLTLKHWDWYSSFRESEEFTFLKSHFNQKSSLLSVEKAFESRSKSETSSNNTSKFQP